MNGHMLLHSQEDADRAAARVGFTPAPGCSHGTPARPRGNQYKANAQRRKAERLFGIFQTAGIRTEADFALVTEAMWEMAAGVAMKALPGYTVRSMVEAMYKGK